MARHFALTVHLYDTRYHGADEWPPAPARAFQALVAGAAQGRHVPNDAASALTLLERLPAPVIAAPAARRGQRVSMFVPNNDLDSVGGDPTDPEQVGKIRTKKLVQPHLLEGDASFLYAWPLPDENGDALRTLADGLYQFGRGVDPAWAVGETLDDEQLAARLRAHRGTVHRPTSGEGASELATPTTSSFASIVRRFDAGLARLRPSGDGKTNFVQPPKAHFAMVRYDGVPAFHLFELRSEKEPEKASPWSTWRAVSLIEHVRDMAAAALKHVLPEREADIERTLVGRKRDGADTGRIEQRVRFVPLPSIGHEHADQSIRRVLVQVPPGALPEGDVLWALKGRSLFDATTGETTDTTLAEATADPMTARYRASSRMWRSVTPLALGSAVRRRIEPTRQRDEAKSAVERSAEERVARQAVAQALRHAGLDASLARATVQREPFDAHGSRAEHFAEGTRFAKESLWHVELELDRAIEGPLVLGDGRFLGLGVMAPVLDTSSLFALDVEGDLLAMDPTALARALRRAVMARVQDELGARVQLPPYFTGHERDGAPTRSEGSTHLAFAVDRVRNRLLVVPPHVLDGYDRPRREDSEHLAVLGRALAGFTELRLGRDGVLRLRSREVHVSTDALGARSKTWRSETDYVVTRHDKATSAHDLVLRDVRRECQRRKLPTPDVIVASLRGVEGVGVVATVELRFAVAVRGPLLLGRSRYVGGGLFCPSGPLVVDG